MNIDLHELVMAGVIEARNIEDEGSSWSSFNKVPFKFVAKLDDSRLEALWRLVEARQKIAPLVVTRGERKWLGGTTKDEGMPALCFGPAPDQKPIGTRPTVDESRWASTHVGPADPFCQRRGSRRGQRTDGGRSRDFKLAATSSASVWISRSPAAIGRSIECGRPRKAVHDGPTFRTPSQTRHA